MVHFGSAVWIPSSAMGDAGSCTCLYTLILFFFQAEDGIRDTSVTGVQTCALPICSDHSSSPAVTRGIQQPTRGLRPGQPQTPPYLVLLRMGFSVPGRVATPAVRS